MGCELLRRMAWWRRSRFVPFLDGIALWLLRRHDSRRCASGWRPRDALPRASARDAHGLCSSGGLLRSAFSGLGRRNRPPIDGRRGPGQCDSTSRRFTRLRHRSSRDRSLDRTCWLASFSDTDSLPALVRASDLPAIASKRRRSRIGPLTDRSSVA